MASIHAAVSLNAAMTCMHAPPRCRAPQDINVYEDGIRTLSEGIYRTLNTSNNQLRTSFADQPFDAKLAATVTSKMSTFKSMFDAKKIG